MTYVHPNLRRVHPILTAYTAGEATPEEVGAAIFQPHVACGRVWGWDDSGNHYQIAKDWNGTYTVTKI